MSNWLTRNRTIVVSISAWETNFRTLAELALEPIYTSRSDAIAAVYTGLCDDTQCDYPVMALIVASDTSVPSELFGQLEKRLADLAPEGCRVDLVAIAKDELVRRFNAHSLAAVELLPAFERRAMQC